MPTPDPTPPLADAIAAAKRLLDYTNGRDYYGSDRDEIRRMGDDVELVARALISLTAGRADDGCDPRDGGEESKKKG